MPRCSAMGMYSPGTVKATYGTGSSLMALTPQLAADTPTLARTVAWSIAGKTQFALEGNIAMTGSAVQWVGEFLNFAQPCGTDCRTCIHRADCRWCLLRPGNGRSWSTLSGMRRCGEQSPVLGDRTLLLIWHAQRGCDCLPGRRRLFRHGTGRQHSLSSSSRRWWRHSKQSTHAVPG